MDFGNDDDLYRPSSVYASILAAHHDNADRFDGQETFLSGRKFRDHLLVEAKDEDLLITTFTISLFTAHTLQFFVSLAEAAKHIRIIGWCDPSYPHGDCRDKLKLYQQLSEISEKYEVRVHAKMHAKVVLFTDSYLGWGGSLNMVDPTMTDLTLRLSAKQYSSVSRWAEKWWDDATALAAAIKSPLSIL